MATISRLKNKKKTNEEETKPSHFSNSPHSYLGGSMKVKELHSPEQEQLYESFYEKGRGNPEGVVSSSTLFPHNYDLQSEFCVPSSFILSPFLALENENANVMPKSADEIPRCFTCKSYMNCYNKLENNRWICFLCNQDNNLGKNYTKNESLEELQSPIYQALAASNFYLNEPHEETYIFLIDISSDAYYSKMIYYTIAAMKEVLCRPELDEICICLFTFNELVQEYDFSGEEIRCTTIDQTIEKHEDTSKKLRLFEIRDKLFSLLDQLESISLEMQQNGSNFNVIFDSLFLRFKHVGAKFFVFQSNEAIIGEKIFSEEPIKMKQPHNEIVPPHKSSYESNNKIWFNKYTTEILKSGCSLSFFVFAKNYKNLKSIHDTLKLTNSELRVYSKDSPEDLEKFYYDLTFILGSLYYRNVRIQFMICSGWTYNAIYGNIYRMSVKDSIVFQIGWCEPTRKITVLVSPTKETRMEARSPFCCIQLVTNYQYKGQSFMSVATIVQPVTGYIERLYPSIDPIIVVTTLSKIFLSNLRMDPLKVAYKKLTEILAMIYKNSISFFKKEENFPHEILTIFQGGLSLLKSSHAQPFAINNTPVFDRVLAERNILQFSGPHEVHNFFNPYLFDLSNMDESMCMDETEFVYPPTVKVAFLETRNGLFLMDCGLTLYLFIAKEYNNALIKEVLGIEKLSKNDILNEDLLNEQTSFKAKQVQNLIRYLREQKSYGWTPLKIIRCKENSLNEKNFYLFFYQEKYEEFPNYNYNLQEFLGLLSQTNF